MDLSVKSRAKAPAADTKQRLVGMLSARSVALWSRPRDLEPACSAEPEQIRGWRRPGTSPGIWRDVGVEGLHLFSSSARLPPPRVRSRPNRETCLAVANSHAFPLSTPFVTLRLG